ATMQYVAMLVREDDGRFTVSVPAMPGCFSMGATRDEALANVREAIEAWLEAERAHGRGPLPETKELLVAAYSALLDDVEALRASGDVHRAFMPELELVQIEVREAVPA